MQVTSDMNFFALPRDVRDIIWAENRMMLREERARITTHFVKEVLRELLKKEFPAKSREVVIAGKKIMSEWMILSKWIGYLEAEWRNCMEIKGKASELLLYSYNGYKEYKLCENKAYEAFISEDFNKYLINENVSYDYYDRYNYNDNYNDVDDYHDDYNNNDDDIE